MTNQPTFDNNASLESSAKKLRKAYDPPKLIIIETMEIKGGVSNLQESDGGGFVDS